MKCINISSYFNLAALAARGDIALGALTQLIYDYCGNENSLCEDYQPSITMLKALAVHVRFLDDHTAIKPAFLSLSSVPSILPLVNLSFVYFCFLICVIISSYFVVTFSLARLPRGVPEAY